MDLYERLEELQGVTRILIDDIALLRDELGERNPDPSPAQKANRRFYIRAVFALVEAFVEQHRQLLVELCNAHVIALPNKKVQRLREIKEVLNPDGTVEESEQHLQIFNKIKEVYKAAGHGFGQPLQTTFADEGWSRFRDAMKLRNRVTHPKAAADCWTYEQDIETVSAANEWFKTLQNEFVRVAREHRAAHRW